MLIDIRIRGCINIQYEDISLENIGKTISENLHKVMCIYKGEKYYSNIDWSGLQPIASQEELLEYIDEKSVHEWVDGLDIDKVEELFLCYKDITTVILGKPHKHLNAVWTANKIDVRNPINFVDMMTYMKLRQKGVASYILNIPAETKNVYGTFCEMTLTEQWMKESKGSNRKLIEHSIKRITDLTCEEYFENVLDKFSERNQEKQLGTIDKSRTIYLIGPCIVAGYSSSEKYLAEILNIFLEKNNLPYKIIKISAQYFPNELLEYDIFQNDIVIFIGADFAYKDYDLTEEYEQYSGVKNLCTNHTLHTSRAGCELIANAIMDEFIIPDSNAADVKNDTQVLCVAEKDQLQFSAEYEVKMYLKRTGVPKHMRRGNNGAIVMNANPYTIGHRKLVEYASRQVDRLFIFVVEEDASYFSFDERFEMVKQGTADMENVIVIASGSFIISNKTFYDYFTKEKDNGKCIDASTDILIFARYIAPYFNITKRFVGEEPIDQITKQYNEQMKKILPKYGCELVEISRFRDEGTIVSGSLVRKALQENDIGCLQRMLSATSLRYIGEHLEILQNRDVESRKRNSNKACLSDRLHKISEILNFIKKENHIIVYGVGNDTVQLLKLLKDEDKENILFADKKAETSEMLFMGKKVLAPCQLIEQYPDYNIIILSSKYYKQIYFECIDLGIKKERILYNPYDLYLHHTLEV